jgi:stage II sporulation protein AA (anti-sigma F factor antagonist)
LTRLCSPGQLCRTARAGTPSGGAAANREESPISVQRTSELDTCTVVELPPEVDLSNSSAVLADLLSAINRGGTHLIVDARAVRFMDSSGLNALIRARQRTEAMNGSLHVVAPTHRLRRLLEISRLDRVLRRVDSIEEARACVANSSGAHQCDVVAPAA